MCFTKGWNPFCWTEAFLLLNHFVQHEDWQFWKGWAEPSSVRQFFLKLKMRNIFRYFEKLPNRENKNTFFLSNFRCKNISWKYKCLKKTPISFHSIDEINNKAWSEANGFWCVNLWSVKTDSKYVPEQSSQSFAKYFLPLNT